MIGKNLESLVIMGAALVIGGIVMWVVDALYGSQRRDVRGRRTEVEEMVAGAAIWIGLCQNLSAVFPRHLALHGDHRRGTDSGLSRTAALEFSFLLSIPTMIAATGYDC